MLIAEDLLLLATDDATGKITVSSTQLDPALAGAVLIELVVAGRVNLQGEGRHARVIVIDGTPLGDPVLDFALQSLVEEGPLKPVSAIQRLAKGLRERLNGLLERRGILRRESGKVLWVFPTTRWPAQDSGYEAQVRGQVVGALLKGLEPDARAAAIISVMAAADMLKTVVERADLKAAKARGKEIGAGNWASDTVRKVIQEAQAAVATAVMVATTVSVTGGSS
jgi:Golgi phosphoprotein 3 (GPP34)